MDFSSNLSKNFINNFVSKNTDITVILEDLNNSNYILRLDYNGFTVGFDIKLNENFNRAPNVNIIESSNQNVVHKGGIPNQFEMETFDTKLGNLENYLDEMLIKIKRLIDGQ